MFKEQTFSESPYVIYLDDCLDVLSLMPDSCVDSIITDPPYGLSFMGKKWDHDVPAVDIWRECLRVLKPGGHLLAFAGTRTQHRMCVNIEDAGFEIRDMIAWVYGSGFPKSHNVSKAIDKAAGAEREVVGSYKATGTARNSKHIGARPHAAIGDYETDVDRIYQTALATPEAQQWDGWGTALKPALEPITVARKPFKGTVANNVLEHGTGAINIDGCRVGTEQRFNQAAGNKAGGNSLNMSAVGMPEAEGKACVGRWPTNLIHDGSDEVVELFPEAKGATSNNSGGMKGNAYSGPTLKRGKTAGRGDNGSAARFFYCAKASKKDREEGNSHPTVKPTDLMAYLCRLVTPPDGVVLDPFMGSGSTGKAAIKEDFKFIGIELNADYFKIAEYRLNNANTGTSYP